MRQLLLLSSLLFIGCSPAYAQGQNCGDRDQVVKKLTAKYGEVRQLVGVVDSDRIMEFWGSKQTGTWSITITTSKGITCLIIDGQSYETLKESVEPRGIRS